MSELYIISDLHLGHESMAINRGFPSAVDQFEYLKKQWNSVIRKKDVVWILGDIGMEKSRNYHELDLMNGIKKVVLGNHDAPQHVPHLLNHVNQVCGMYKYKQAWFTHCPMHPSELRGNEINIHGHMHKNKINDHRYINVSCELVDYTPIPLKSLL